MLALAPQDGMTPEEAILALLVERAGGATICPSEAARRLAGPQGDWRAEMEAIHAAADALAEQGAVSLSWKGQPMRERRGPYRIARR
jgi:hypothetical protein